MHTSHVVEREHQLFLNKLKDKFTPNENPVNLRVLVPKTVLEGLQDCSYKLKMG